RGENEATTVNGTPNPSVNAHPITKTRTGSSRTGSNMAASIAPLTANRNTTASTNTFDHAARLGRERGKESPISVSSAIATRAGRTAAPTKPCTMVSPRAAPPTAPRIAYWTSRDPVAPAIAPTTIDTTAIPTALPATARATAPRVQAYV